MRIIDNLAIKIGALLIALFLWFHAITEKDYEVKRRASIQITAIPEGLILAKPIPTEAIVRLKGTGKQLIVLYFSDLHLMVDATWAKKGATETNLYPEHVDIPQGRGATVTEIVSPWKIDLEFDTQLEKKVMVRSDITIEPLEGYVQVGSIAFRPDSDLVIGPDQQVKAIDSVTTDSINYSGVKKAITDVVKMLTPKEFNVTVVPQRINASIDIQRLVQRTIDEIPVTLIHLPPGTTAHLEPGVISITVSGGEKYLSTLTREDFSVSADYRRARRRTDNRINARIDLPHEVELTGAEPQMFTVITGS
jgi:YbbR domain-containing protein